MCMQPLATRWLVIRNTAKQLEMKVQEAEGTGVHKWYVCLSGRSLWAT